MSDSEKGTADPAGIQGAVSHQEEAEHPPHHGMSAGAYLGSRLSSLKPPMNNAPNPIKLIMMLNRTQWAFFGVAFFAWSWDAFDFFTVSLTAGDLSKTFGKSTADITWGITLVLMLRSVGSILFGIAADRYGRKWPFIVNNVLFIVLELEPASVRHTNRSWPAEPCSASRWVVSMAMLPRPPSKTCRKKRVVS